jgi:hypothetical protein
VVLSSELARSAWDRRWAWIRLVVFWVVGELAAGRFLVRHADGGGFAFVAQVSGGDHRQQVVMAGAGGVVLAPGSSSFVMVSGQGGHRSWHVPTRGHRR